MTSHFRELAAQVAADGAILPEEILILRRACWSDGKIDAEEADAIFGVNARIREHDAAWADFFVEAVGEFVLSGGPPEGEVDEVKADWLMTRIERGGATASMAEIALLAKLLERATGAPYRLRSHGIAQIEHAVMTGNRGIGDVEARLLRRLIFAPTSGRTLGVGRAEAELLLRLKDATLGAANGADWQRLFVQGVANYLMAYTLDQPLSRERAADLEDFIARPNHGVGRFFTRMARCDARSGFTALFGRHAVSEQGGEPDVEIDEYEQALMDFLSAESAGSIR